MSDDSKRGPLEPGQEGLPDRLASLRESIRASKERQARQAAEAAEAAEETPSPSEPDTASLDEISEEEEIAETQVSEIIAAQDIPRMFEDASEPADITDDLHRVMPPDDTAGASLSDEMDRLSEAAEEAPPPSATEYEVEPTVIQHLDDIAGVQGTPLYMSPEQCRGEAVTPATDVYSFGVVLFELLEGYPPYMAPTIEEVLFKHQDACVPELFSEFTPDDVKALVMRMLAKDPAARPDMAEVIDILKEHVSIAGPDVHGLEEESWSVSEVEEGAPVAVGPPMPVMQTGDMPISAAKRPPWLMLGAVGLVVLLLTWGATMKFGSDPDPVDDQVAPPEPPVAVADREPAQPPSDEPPATIEPAAVGTPDTGQPAEEPLAEEPVVEEPVAEELVIEEPAAEPEPEPKPRPKKHKKRRKKKKKERELREIRLDL